MARVSSKRHATTILRWSSLARKTGGIMTGLWLLLKGIWGKTSPRVRVPPLRYLALHKSAENGNFGFPRNLITLTSSSLSARRRLSPLSVGFSFLSRDPLFPPRTGWLSFCVPPVSSPRDSPATIRIRYIIKYFCVRAAGDNRGS